MRGRWLRFERRIARKRMEGRVKGWKNASGRKESETFQRMEGWKCGMEEKAREEKGQAATWGEAKMSGM